MLPSASRLQLDHMLLKMLKGRQKLPTDNSLLLLWYSLVFPEQYDLDKKHALTREKKKKKWVA